MNTLFTGQNIIELATVDSTNNFAAELIDRGGVSDGTVILASEQTSGRGQRGNTWVSAPFQNLTCSIILRPTFLAATDQFLLSKVVSLGVHDFLTKQLHADAGSGAAVVKWPNDLLFNEQKICGLLIESVLRGNFLSEAVVGIGLNVNQVNFANGLNATSMKLESGRHHDVKACLAGLCEMIEARYFQLRSGKLELLHRDYLRRLYHFGTWHPYRLKGQEIQGKITGVANQGRLQLLTAQGEISCDFKEIVHL